MTYFKYIVLILGGFFTACTHKDAAFDQSPSQRNKFNIQQLHDELVQAPNGWRMQYFPKTDSLLYASRNEHFSGIYPFASYFTAGGFYYTAKFHTDGTVEMRADASENTITHAVKSEFEVKQSTLLQLSFTTTNYLHSLVNETLQGNSDVLFVRKDINGNLLFRTPKSIEPARDYILLEKIPTPDGTISDVTSAYNNRLFFEQMTNPQLTISVGDRIYFKSDMPALREETKRYALFRFNTTPDVFDSTSWKINALGSGYTGTEVGISFHAGIRYSASYVFYDFVREGDSFVCELVRIYDAQRKEYRYMSKHLAEKYNHSYEDVFYKAVIKNQ